MTTTVQDKNRFAGDARRYADYLGTPEGRLRADLSFANLCEFLPEVDASRAALDVGCGTGLTAVRLAQPGMKVAALDSSSAMLALAKETVDESHLHNKVSMQAGDVAQLRDLFPEKSFDVIVCHNLLEYVDSPQAVLSDLACLMRDSSSILSILVRNQAGEVLKSAIHAGDLAAAENNLTAEWGTESLYQGAVRLFRAGSLESILSSASLAIVARRGVRVLADYLPDTVSRAADYSRIFALERKLAGREEFFGVARYLQYLCSPSSEANRQAVLL